MMAASPEGWTTETLYLHLSERIAVEVQAGRDRLAALDERQTQHWAAHDAAHTAKGNQMDERLEAQRRESRALDESFRIALNSAKEAVEKAETATEYRFKSVNEFRATLTDQTARFIPRVEVDSRVQAMGDKIIDLSARMDRADGKGIGIAAIWGVILGGAGLLSIIATITLNVIRH